MSNNEIKLTIQVDDHLIDKVLSFLAITTHPNALQGAMPMLMGAIGGQGKQPPPKGEEKPSMGFKMDDKK